MSDPTVASYYLDEHEDAAATQEAAKREIAEIWQLNPVFEAWAIRHKPTGAFLPTHWTDKGYGFGYSYDEPTPGAFPRLFRSKRAAQSALTMWLQGRWRTEVEHEYSDGYRIGSYRTEPQIRESGESLGRRREDMEVVPVVLRIDTEGAA